MRLIKITYIFNYFTMTDVGTLSSYKIAALIKDRQTYMHAWVNSKIHNYLVYNFRRTDII